MIRQGNWEDFDEAAALNGDAELLRWRWRVPSFDPARHLWLADGAFGALYAPDDAIVRGKAAHATELLQLIEARAREESIAQLTTVIPESETEMRRAYEDADFGLMTEVLEMAVVFDEPPPEPAYPDGIEVRTYTDADAHRVRELLDEAYAAWDDAYAPFTHEDWVAFMTDHDTFDPGVWFLAEAGSALAGVCLTWNEGWIKDLAVAPAARGRGLGEALVRHAFARLYERGVRQVGLKVDSHNPTSAIRLYERVGMRTVKRYGHYLKKL